MSKPSILIVDDQDHWRDLFFDLLDADYEITTAESYVHALEILLKQLPSFHLVISDLRLDDVNLTYDGLRLIGQINKINVYTKTIIVTGYPPPDTLEKALQELNIFHYVQKYPEDGYGFDRASFSKIVRNAVSVAETTRQKLHDLPGPDTKVYVRASQFNNEYSNSFTQSDNRVLVIEADKTWREELSGILAEYRYNVDKLDSTNGIVDKLKTQTYELLIINNTLLATDGDLLATIFEHDPTLKIIMTEAKTGEFTANDLLQNRVIYYGIVSYDKFFRQKFVETVRLAFAPEAFKYITASFEEIRDQTRLRIDKSYILTLTLQDNWDNPEIDALQIWLPNKDVGATERILRVLVDASDMHIKPDVKEFTWRIPARGYPPQLKIAVIPQLIGKKTIFIDVEQGRFWLGQLKMDVEITDKTIA